MECRVGCGACCIAPSISTPIPALNLGPGLPAIAGMPHGKPAGVRCAMLTDDNRCRLFGRPERPPVCASLRPTPEMCGASASEALVYLTQLEFDTR